MDRMIAYCGLACHECPARLATEADCDERRAEVAAQWSREYNADIQPGDIHCAGCRSASGPHFRHCHECKIRACASARAVDTCAACDDYACEELTAFFAMVPPAKEALDKLRS